MIEWIRGLHKWSEGRIFQFLGSEYNDFFVVKGDL